MRQQWREEATRAKPNLWRPLARLFGWPMFLVTCWAAMRLVGTYVSACVVTPPSPSHFPSNALAPALRLLVSMLAPPTLPSSVIDHVLMLPLVACAMTVWLHQVCSEASG